MSITVDENGGERTNDYYKEAIKRIVDFRRNPKDFDTVEFLLFLASENPELLVDSFNKTKHSQIVSLLRKDKKIQAVKLYREQAGVTLREAKEYVDQIIVNESIPLPPNRPDY